VRTDEALKAFCRDVFEFIIETLGKTQGDFELAD
jgi:hypothetical protein